MFAKYLVDSQGVAGRMADIGWLISTILSTLPGVNVGPASKQSHLECVSRACLMG